MGIFHFCQIQEKPDQESKKHDPGNGIMLFDGDGGI